MSFYGNIVNYLTKGYKKVKLPGNREVEADSFESELDLSEDLTLKIWKDTQQNQDGNLTYFIQLGPEETNQIKFDIPLDLILESSEITDKDGEGNLGQFIKLTFRTTEKTEEIVYIDVANIIPNSGITTEKIADGAITKEKIAQGAIVQGNIAENAVTKRTIVDGAVDSSKISNGAVTKEKLHSNLQKEISKSVQFDYDEKNKCLKISYVWEENNNGTTT